MRDSLNSRIGDIGASLAANEASHGFPLWVQIMAILLAPFLKELAVKIAERYFPKKSKDGVSES
jgi:hypothetical protein